ncbi:MAG: response regulator [Rhodospirillales bacterium]
MYEAIALIAAAAAVAAVLWCRGKSQAAQAAAARLDATMEALPVAHLVTGPDGRTVANRRWRERFGAPGGDPLGAFAAGPAADLERLRAAAAAGAPADANLIVDTGGAGEAVVRVWVRPLDGQPGHLAWTVAEPPSPFTVAPLLRAEDARLAAFAGGAAVGAYSASADGRLVFVSPVLAAWLGRTPDALTAGATVADIAAAAPAGALACALLPGEESGEIALKRADGSTFAALVHQKFLRDAEGRVCLVRSLVRDLDAERAAATRIGDSAERFRRYFEDAPVGIVLVDRAGQVVEANPTFAHMVGRADADLAGTALAACVAREDAGRLAGWLAEATAAAGKPTALEVRLGRPGAVAAALTAGRLDSAAGEASGLIVHVIDVTTQKSLENQFLQSQKMELVGKLAGGVAHDFNNLLTAMIGFCDLLLQRHSAKDPSFADIMQIKQNANRAANLVRQLLAFSRQQTLQPKVTQLTDVLTELSHLLRRLIGANIELKLIHGRDLGLVKVDQHQFEQVVVNLAVNARDAMADGGTLTIRTSNVGAADPRLPAYGVPPGEYVMIEAIDTGHGIAQEHIDKIFEPFFTTKEVGSGTGLGLSTVYGIVKQTGGHIHVSSAPEKGATFIILLPRHTGAVDAADLRADAKEDALARRDLTGAGTVLLVEDEDAVRLFGARALRNKGYNVLEARNGEVALELLSDATKPVDLVITDVVMPGMDGPALIRHVREKHPDLKVIFISGYTEDSFRKRLGEGETVHFLPKPFSLQQLAGKVKEVMNDTAQTAA